MKLKELENLDCTFIYPADVAELLECNPQDVRQSIKEGTFGFECIRIGNTTQDSKKHQGICERSIRMDRWHEQLERALASHERYWLDPDTYYKDCEEEEEEEIPTCSKCGGYNDNDELGGSWCSKCEKERIMFIKRTINQAIRDDRLYLGYILEQIFTDAEVTRELVFYFQNHKDIYKTVTDIVAMNEKGGEV